MNNTNMNPQQIAEQLRNLANQIELTPEQHRAVDAALNEEIAATSNSDPCAELKASHAEGKVIPIKASSNWHDLGNKDSLSKGLSAEYCRIKPDFQLPPPPPGRQWHHEDGWTEDMLPQGYRPLAVGEPVQNSDETPGFIAGRWQKANASVGKWASDRMHWRTTRPLTFTHEGKTWTWHRPGDPIPCDKTAMIHHLDTEERCYGPERASTLFNDFGKDYPWPIIGWRYAEPEF